MVTDTRCISIIAVDVGVHIGPALSSGKVGVVWGGTPFPPHVLTPFLSTQPLVFLFSILLLFLRLVISSFPPYQSLPLTKL